MSLKTHIVARRWTPAGSGAERVLTHCGEEGFKSLRVYQPEGEYQAVRRIGGLVAVSERKFFPDRNACAKCQRKWEAGEAFEEEAGAPT